jgi:Lon protease-like protein
MSEALTLDFNKPVPLLPLGSCVLLPHATVPLHIFEQRYKAMVSDALDSRGLIAMATYKRLANEQADMHGPGVRPYVCVGYILRHESLRDGRYNILLQGLCRARLRKEVYHEPYRLGFLEPVDTDTPMEIDLDEQRQRLEALLDDDTLNQLASISSIQNWLSQEIPTPALVDLAILTVCSDVDQRYSMLAEPDEATRAAWLEHHLKQTRQTLNIAARYADGPSEEGCTLN